MTVVRLERHGEAVAIVTLDRPEVRNCIDRRVCAELSAALAEAEADAAIRVVVLTGAGDRAFSAGADLGEVAGGHLFDLFAAGGFAGFTHAPRRKPWIAAVNGAALAGGCEIALACDIIVAAEHAVFGLPEPRRGLIAGAGGIYRLADALPPKLAAELLLTGDTITATRAAEIGLVNHVVPASELISHALAIAERIVASAPLAIALTLDVLRAARSGAEPRLQALCETHLATLAGSADFAEGATAFLEKRPPIWSWVDDRADIVSLCATDRTAG